MGEDGKIIYKVIIDDTGIESEAASSGRKAGKSMAGAANGSTGLEQVMIGAARRIGVAFVEMAAGAAQQVSSFVTDAVQVGMGFETAMDQVAATLGLSADEIEHNIDGAADTFDMLRKKAEEMGAETKFTATEAAEGLNILAMSGYDATASVAMIEDVLHLAAAGSMDMASAAGYISGSLKGFNDDTKDSQYYADLMAKGATLAATSVSQLGDALSGSAATAASYGQSAESTTVALLRLAEQGEVGSNAATMLAAAMKNLYAPTDQAKELLTQLGVDAFDPVTHEARDFNTVVNELSSVLSGYSDEQRTAYAQTIFGIQGFNAYNKMVVTTTAKQNEWADALSKSTGEAAAQYGTMTDNLQGDLDILNSTLDSFRLAIFDKLQPAMRSAAKFGSEAVGEITAAFQEDGVEGAAQAAMQILSGLLDNLLKGAPDMVNSGIELIISLIDGMAASTPQIITTVSQLLVILLQAIVDHLPQLLASGLNLILALIMGLISAIPQLISAVPILITSLISAFVENLPQILALGVQLIMSIISGILVAVPELLATIPELIQQLIDIFTNTDWASIGANIVNGIWAGIQSLWGTLTSNVSSAFGGLVDSVTGFLGIASPSKKFKWIFEMVTAGAIEGMEDTEDNMRQTVRRIYGRLPEVAQEAIAPDGVSGFVDRESFERDISYNLQASATTGGVTVVTPLYLDGREVARATAWSMGEQLAWEEM